MKSHHMNRRNFIEIMGVLGAAALLPASGTPIHIKPKYKMGLQLYTIRDDMAKDPIGSLKAARRMGYRDFEHYGFDAEKGTFYGYPAVDFKKILEDMKLSFSSGHYAFAPYLERSDDELTRFVDSCIEGAKAVDLSYITWPFLPPEQRTRDNFKLMARKLNRIGERVTAAGLGFAYHNHGFEFEDYGGESGFDIILADTDPELVKLQMDMYWVMHAGKHTPKELIDMQPGRYVMWHIKDMDKVSRDYTELGNGSIDYVKILPDPTKSGLEYYYIEQGGNYTHTPMKSIADSAKYCKKRLRKYL